MMPLVATNNIRKPKPMKPVGRTVHYEYPHHGYSHYVTTIISIASLRNHFLTYVNQIKVDYKLHDDQEEHLFDWLISEAVNRSIDKLYSATLVGHYRHDVYKLVYESLDTNYAVHVQHLLQSYQFHLQPGQQVKLLVAGDIIILVKGSIPNV